MNSLNRLLFATCCALTASNSVAEIYLDHESDAVPYVTLNIVVPQGAWALSESENSSGALLSKMWDVGTTTKTNSEFLGQLADFGASYSVVVGPQHTALGLSFPLEGNKDLSGLLALVQDNWLNPRVTEEELAIAKTVLESTFKGLLDRDFALTSSFLRRWVTKNLFGGFPVNVEQIKNVKLNQVKAIHSAIVKEKDIWVGYVGPDSSLEFVKSFVEKVFSAQGSVVEKELKKSLVDSRISLKSDVTKLKPTIFLIDRKGLAQSTVDFLAIPNFKPEGKQELNYYFGSYVLTGSGLGSVFMDEIRVKRGISYAVTSTQPDLYNQKNISIAFNPTKSKQEEGIRVLSELLTHTFEQNKLFENMSDKAWNDQFRSFKYSQLIDRSTSVGRLDEKMSVVMGALSSSLKDSKPERWKVSRDAVFELYNKMWNQSFRSIAVLGDASELSPLLKKYFPGYEMQVIPYKEALVLR